MIPTQVGLIKDFYNRNPIAKVSAAELSALNFLRTNSEVSSVILTPSKNKDTKATGPVPDIWAWSDSGYVAALSGRREYFSDREQVDIMGYDFASRKEIRTNVFESTDPTIVGSIVKSSGVNYIYYPKGLSPKVDFGKIGLTQILDNQEVSIWRTTNK